MMKIEILERTEAAAPPRALNTINDKKHIRTVDHLPRCEASRVTRYARGWEDEHPDKTCSRCARYRIDGVNLCSQHAGEVTLNHVLKFQENEND